MNKFLRLACLSTVLSFASSLGIAQQLVISEVYGGGGNTGATLKNDFIELYNPTGTIISLAGWSVQYASATGTTWQVTNLFGSIAAKGFYLVQQAQGSGGTVNLPAPDATGTIAMSATAGKIALCNSTTALSGSNPISTAIIDLVGFGTTANGFEGAASAAPSSTTSIERKAKATSDATSMGAGGVDEFLGNGQDSNNNLNDFIVRLSPQPQNTSSSFEPVLTDTTPPTFTSTYPKTSNLTSSGFDLITNLNEIGKTYFVVLPDNASLPTSTQVKNGQDALGIALASNLVGIIDVSAASTDFNSAITGLTDNTNYDVFIVAEDPIPNLQAAPVRIDVQTNLAGDITAPVFSVGFPVISIVQPTGFTIKVSLDETGITYFVVLPSSATPPTSLQIINGQDASGNLLAADFRGTIRVNIPATEFTFAPSTLIPSTSYDVYLVAGDFVPNFQITPVKISITTGDQFVEEFNACDGTASFTQFSVAGPQTWGCTDFGRGGTKAIRMNGFSGSAIANEDWLISPLVSLSANPSLSFYSQFSFAGNGLQLKISTDYNGSDDPNTATWTDLNGNFPTVAVPSNSSSLSDWTLSNVDLAAYASQNIYVAFVYISTSTSAARWTLDEISFNNAIASYLDITPSALFFTRGGSVKSYTLKAVNLSNDITLIAPVNFTVSKNNSTFSSTISYTALEAATPQTVYVKFVATSGTTETFKQAIFHNSTGVASKNIFLTGTDKLQTLDISTYNLEFFGTDVKNTSGVEFGPVDDALQISNVSTVMQTIDSDIYAVEEVADDFAFSFLIGNLPGYNGVLSDRWSYSFNAEDPNFPPQKIGFIFNAATVEFISGRVMFSKLYDDVRAGNTSLLPGYPTSGGNTPVNFWSSGRLPFMATFDVTVKGIKKRIRAVVIHAKSGSAQADYDRRKYDVQVLKDSLVANYANDDIILLGDFNDDVDTSINTGSESTYKPFVDDATNFNSLTYAISQAGAVSFPNSSSFLDHIITSNELTTAYVGNSITVEDPRAYISNYINTTSDHLPVSARFIITKSDQVITFNTLPAKTFGDASFTLSATSTSGLPVSFIPSDATIASISGNTVTILKAGAVNITASQAGDANYNVAADVVQPLTINKANQTITFAALSVKNFGDAAFALSANSSSSLAISFSSSDATIASVTGNTVTIIKAGTVNITASQIGDASFNVAADVVQPLTINKANQVITFTAIPDKLLGDLAFTASATSTSGLAVTLTPNSKISIAGNQVTIVSAGKASITASQSGNENYNAAPSVVRDFCIKPAKPTINVSLVGSTVTLTSSAASGNQWFLNNVAISSATNNTHTSTTAGTYKVQVTIDNCISDFSADTPVVITGDLTISSDITIYPNPADDRLMIIGLEEETRECTVVDLVGRSTLLSLTKQKGGHEASVENFSSGVYLVRVQQSNAIQQIKFVKK